MRCVTHPLCLLPLFSVLAACASTPSPSRKARSVETATLPAQPPLPVATPATTAPPLLALASPPSAHVEAKGCKLEGRVERLVGLSYASSDLGAMFGAATGAENVVLVVGDKPGAASSLALDILGLHFDAQTPENGVRLYSRAPLGIAGVFDPEPSLPLNWQLGADGLVVALGAKDLSPSLLVPFEKTVACTEVGLERASFTKRALPRAAYYASAKIKTAKLPLSPKPGAPAVAELPARSMVSVVSEKGADAEITYEDRGLWHGWVPQASIVRQKGPLGEGYGSGHGRVVPQKYPGGHTCDEDLPLYVRAAGAAAPIARVGNVRKGHRVALEASEDAEPFRVLMAEQRPQSSTLESLTLRAGFELVVDRELASRCKPE